MRDVQYNSTDLRVAGNVEVKPDDKDRADRRNKKILKQKVGFEVPAEKSLFGL